jgi:hypothetical protein
MNARFPLLQAANPRAEMPRTPLWFLLDLQSLFTSVAPLSGFCARTGGFASPPHSGFALIVCDNMHNVGFYYKRTIVSVSTSSTKRDKSANCVTFLWPITSSKIY